jgi:DNA repair exonuclease SbcCD ATPase subunit
LKAYVDKQLVVIKNDLESVGLANLYEKLKFSVSSDFNDELNNKKREIETQVQELQGVEEVKEQIIEGKSKKSMEVDLNTLTNDYISKLPLSKISVLISTLESKSSLAEDKRKTIRLFEEKIEKNHKRINELEKSIKDIEDTKKPLLHKKVKERDEEYKNYFILLQEEKKVLEELYAPLRKKLDKEDLGEKNKIEFFARIELDVENFFNKADSIIDFSRTGRYFRKRDLLFKEIKTISEKIEFTETLDIFNLIILLYKTFEEDEDNLTDISEQLLRGRKKIDFYNWIFDISDFSVTYSIKYQGTNIELLSPGKKGIVLLLMYLVLDTESSIPLIIDQPEENLDNKSIYPYLINYFKKAKKRRQIIVITHNPNLVLNTDAEQIVVANFEAIPHTQDARIRYISGAIENSFVSEKAKIPIEKQGIKEHGIDILEGGPEAFGKREDRYEIERLKK